MIFKSSNECATKLSVSQSFCFEHLGKSQGLKDTFVEIPLVNRKQPEWAFDENCASDCAPRVPLPGVPLPGVPLSGVPPTQGGALPGSVTGQRRLCRQTCRQV